MARGGFEPPKPLGRQIYSLLRLTAPQPRRFFHVRPQPNDNTTNPPIIKTGTLENTPKNGINCSLERFAYYLNGADSALTLRLNFGAGEGI